MFQVKQIVKRWMEPGGPPGHALNTWRRTNSEMRVNAGAGLKEIKETSMTITLRRIVFALTTTLFCAVPAFAQTPEQVPVVPVGGLGYIAAGVGFAIAAGLAALGQGRVAAAACEGAARNPNAYPRIQTAMILGLAFIETLVIFTFVIVLLKIR